MRELLLAAPALPLDDAGPYVAGAYLVFVALLLIYVGIMAAKLQRITRELGELAELAERANKRDVGARNEVPHPTSSDDRSPSAPSTAGPAATLAPETGGSGREAEQPPDSFEEAPVDV